MEKPLLILITGHTASGKTTLAKKISSKFDMMLVGIDDVKELIWDNVGWKHTKKEWEDFGKASFNLMYYFIEIALSKKEIIIAEANFSPEMNNERINELKEKYNCELLQIYCYAERKMLLKRFEKRIESDDYHPGHRHGLLNIYSKKEFLSRLGMGDKLLDIKGETIKVDTTDSENIDYEKIFNFIHGK